MSIRVATEADTAQILAVYVPYILHSTHTFEYTVPSEAEFRERLRVISTQFPWLVWEEDGRILGYAYGSAPFERAAYRWCAEVSIYLTPEVRGKGIGRRLYAALEQILWLQGYRVLYALVTDENAESLAFHRSLGYKEVARLPRSGVKFGRWLGVVWLEKRSQIVEIPSQMPETFLSIVENDRKFAKILDILTLS